MSKEKLTTKTLVEIELSFLRKMAKDLGKMKATLTMLHQYEFGLDKINASTNHIKRQRVLRHEAQASVRLQV